MNNLEKFLDFNGKRISILLADGTWWVAVKPICEALNVNYDRSYKNIKEDEILSQLYAKQHTTGADGKTYLMVCLPEKYVYGWLFSIRSESPGLLEYKKVCYDVLYNHFHGAITGRVTALTERSATDEEIRELQVQLEEKLQESEEYRRIQELKNKKKNLDKTLRQMDSDLLQGQLKIDF